MKHSCHSRKISLPVLFWITAAGIAAAQFDFRGMIDGARDQVQEAVNGFIDRCYGFYMKPMVPMYAKARERRVGFDIPRDLMPDIQSVQIELVE